MLLQRRVAFVIGDGFQNQFPLFLSFLRLSGFVEYACQHEAGGDARLQGDAGFEVTLRLAPQAAAVGKLSEVHQERCVVGFVFQPRISKVDGFLLAAFVEEADAFDEGFQKFGAAVLRVVLAHPFDGFGIESETLVFFGNGDTQFVRFESLGNALQTGFQTGCV